MILSKQKKIVMEAPQAQDTSKGKAENLQKHGQTTKEPKLPQQNQPTTQRVQVNNIHRLVSKNSLEQVFKEKCGEKIPM